MLSDSLYQIEFLIESPVNIDQKEVLKLQGYRADNYSITDDVKELVAKAIRMGYELAEPAGAFRWVGIDSMEAGNTTLDTGATLHIGSGVKNWQGAEYLVLGLCTIGTKLEKKVAGLFSEQEFALASMLDSAGSVAAESLAEYINGLVDRKAAEIGIYTGPRLSPGFGKWQIQDQKIIFEALPARSLNIRLSESYIMLPEKSISFGIGAGRNVKGRKLI